LCVNCKRIDETIEEVVKRKKDTYKQREIRTVGTTDFTMPEITPLSGPDDDALNQALNQKGFAVL
jgi:thiol-disulfide isomerase/thioredoxin